MTVAMFGLLFKSELAGSEGKCVTDRYAIGRNLAAWILFLHKLRNTASVALGFRVPGRGGWRINLVRILRRRAVARVAAWYAASIAITLLASVSEVFAASFGARTLSSGLNGATGALRICALLVAAAVAEHMRAVRQEAGKRVTGSCARADEDSPIGLFSISATGSILNANPSFRKMPRSLGLEKATQIAQVFDRRVTMDLASLYGTKSRFIELQTKVHDNQKSQDRWFAIKASTMTGDIGGRHSAGHYRALHCHRTPQFLANHDPLTECLNLRGISRTLGRLARQPAALAYFDLDRFKLINDLYGHSAGDMVLKQVCRPHANGCWHATPCCHAWGR